MLKLNFLHRNLCYLDFLKENEPITCAAFEKYYKGLSKADIKVYSSSLFLLCIQLSYGYEQKWNLLSKTSKTTNADE